MLAGQYFGYDSDGNAIWLQLAGQLLVSESDTVIWELNTDLFQVTGGECIFNCASNNSTSNNNIKTQVVGSIRLKFNGRSSASFSIDNKPIRQIAPFTYGVPAEAAFAEQADVLFPNLTGTWLLAAESVFTAQLNHPTAITPAGVATVIISDKIVTNTTDQQRVVYPMHYFTNDSFIEARFTNPPGNDDELMPILETELVCVASSQHKSPVCHIEGTRQSVNPNLVTIISDSRLSYFTVPVLTGGSPPSSVATKRNFFRLNYD